MLDRVRAVRRPGRTGLVLVALLALLLTSLPAGASPNRSAQGAAPAFQGESGRLGSVDRRAGLVRPSGRQRSLVAAERADARWNAFGTPRSLVRHGGALAGAPAGDPATAARRWLLANRELFRLSSKGVAGLDLLHQARIGKGTAVTFRQRFGGLPAAHDGLVTLAVLNGKVVYVSSSIAGDGNAPAAATLSAVDAWRAAAADVGRQVAAADVGGVAQQHGWTRMTVKGFSHPQLARLAALPTPTAGVRPVWETLVLDNQAEPLAFTSFVDARTGKVLLRENLVDHAQDAPDPAKWKVFPASPRLDYSSADTRQIWCWDPSGPDCQRVLNNPAARVPWDVDARTGQSTHTSIGNAARSFENWNSNDPFSVGVNPATPRPDRGYVYPWANQWFTERCNPDTTFTSPQRNDIDAAIANLFAMHNRMHDWSWFLGFTEQNFNLQDFNFGLGGAENDPEQGNAQAGGISGGPPDFEARDNANQITPPDGVPPITNMYLWQPIAGGFYAPCVDGDFDMTVIGHEYTHAISNRMVAGPDGDLDGPQAGAMGESWSDLTAMEYLNEYRFVPVNGENRYAIGPYVTSDHQAGIRNYGMNRSPLNYSDIGYDVTGPQVHADGEIWSATNFDIRQAMIARYNSRFPAGDAGLQRRCADGQRPADRCPGNRRWIQIVFDAYLLMAIPEVSMVDARDAYLAADVLRFGGANQATLWNAFARRGLGEGAFSNTNADPDPVPSFTSPYANEARVRFQPVDEDGHAVVGQLFVGRYQGRAVPLADTDPATPLGATFRIVPGSYDLIARADGFGAKRLTQQFRSGQVRDLPVTMPRNLASAHNGATASGDGVSLDSLIDDTEATNWASLGVAVEGRQVTVRLDPSKPSYQITRVQVSAHLRPPNDPNDPVQSRFSALRQFQILACEAKAGVDCADDADFAVVFTSPADAFPSIAPRPRAPDLILRSFDIPRTRATHVRLRVLTNQCTGAPDYQGEQDNDPRAATDCSDASPQALNVRAAELQVFRR